MDGMKTLKSRPGLTIIQYWQGVVEIIIRILAITFAAISVCTYGLAPNYSLDGSVKQFVSKFLMSMIGLDYDSLITYSVSAAVVGISIACAAILYELVIIILRFLNVGFINSYIRIFLILDIIASLMFTGGFVATGIFAAYFASQWASLNIHLLNIGILNLGIERVELAMQFLSSLTGASFGAAVAEALLIPWMLLFLFKSWNRNVATPATVKDIKSE